MHVEFVARTIIHEWGHFRWGLFDEYPHGRYDSYYRGGENHVEVIPLTCAKHMRGEFTSLEGELCDSKYMLREGPFETNKCHFVDNRKDPGVRASLMFRHYIPDVSI